jgi:hypothetical protein
MRGGDLRRGIDVLTSDISSVSIFAAGAYVYSPGHFVSVYRGGVVRESGEKWGMGVDGWGKVWQKDNSWRRR